MKINASATRWEHGWELSIGGDVVTQVTTFDKAAQQIRDYLDTVDNTIDHRSWDITVTPDLGDLTDRVPEV